MNIVLFKKRTFSFIFLFSACSGLYADDQANTNAACPHPQSIVEKDSFSYFSSKQSGSSLVAASKHEKNMDIYRSLCGPSPKFLLNEQILQIMGKSYPNYFAVEPLLVKNEQMPSKTSGPTAAQPTKQQSYNPICRNPVSQVEIDSINYFNQKYPDSSADQNNMHKQNMETYKKLCSSPLKEKLGKSTIELINSSYPDYGVMLGVLDKEVNALKELQKYVQKAPPSPKEQPTPVNTPALLNEVNNTISETLVQDFCYALEASVVCKDLNMRVDTERKIESKVGMKIRGPESPYNQACIKGVALALKDEKRGICSKAWKDYGCYGNKVPRSIQENPFRNRKGVFCEY